jgi:hypothetical protein
MRSYGCVNVQSDKYAGTWVTEAFLPHGIRVEQIADVKSQLYINMLPLLYSKRLSLLDMPRLINQICALERNVNRGARDTIDHPKNAHDDLANACAGVCSLAVANQGVTVTPDLLAKVYAMPKRRHHTKQHGNLASMLQAMQAMGLQPQRNTSGFPDLPEQSKDTDATTTTKRPWEKFRDREI